MNARIYVAFFLSGAAGLIYQVLWVREFGNIFGNTIHSASLVTGVFMLGLGIGGYLAGRWADRPDFGSPTRSLRLYGLAEAVIAIAGLVLAIVIPHLDAFAAWGLTYEVGPNGWLFPSGSAYAARYLVAFALLLPVTMVMGATLTLLIRYLLAENIDRAGWRVGLLYGANTGGAAIGAFLTDFLLVPTLGLLSAAGIAVFFNLVAALIAFRIAPSDTGSTETTEAPVEHAGEIETPAPPASLGRREWFTAATIFLSGFAAMGIEIAWFRFFNLSLGGYRSVFSLVLTVMLLAMWAGSVTGGAVHRRFGRPKMIYIATQCGVVVSTVALLLLQEPHGAINYFTEHIGPDFITATEFTQRLMIAGWELRSIAIVIAIPAFLMGFAFPVANAMVQTAEESIGTRAGALYLANTVGAVLGSLITGFVLIPELGTQVAVTILTTIAAASIVTVFLATRTRTRADLAIAAVAIIVSAGTVGLWTTRPELDLLEHAVPPLEGVIKVKAISEGLYETIVVTEDDTGARRLNTNAHSMSGTTPDALRYMRLFSHFPLLHLDDPKKAVVICFGVGNTVHAASLHPSLEELQVVDLSQNVLNHARYFEKWNEGVIEDPRVKVHIQDGRLHLRTEADGTFDLITLEPPPITFAGVSSLYSREFYELARQKLAEDGFMTQWLPIYQVQPDVALAIIRAFIEVFPNAILVVGANHELILAGQKSDGNITITLDGLQRRLENRPGVAKDLDQIRAGTLTDFIGLFGGGSDTLAEATEGVPPITDDFPRMEYGIDSSFYTVTHPGTIYGTHEALTWCTDCWSGEARIPDERIPHINVYFAFFSALYADESYRTYESWAGSDQTSRIRLPPGVTPDHPVFRETQLLRGRFGPK